MVKKRYYDPEFKREAVRLVLKEGRRDVRQPTYRHQPGTS